MPPKALKVMTPISFSHNCEATKAATETETIATNEDKIIFLFISPESPAAP